MAGGGAACPQDGRGGGRSRLGWVATAARGSSSILRTSRSCCSSNWGEEPDPASLPSSLLGACLPILHWDVLLVHLGLDPAGRGAPAPGHSPGPDPVARGSQAASHPGHTSPMGTPYCSPTAPHGDTQPALATRLELGWRWIQQEAADQFCFLVEPRLTLWPGLAGDLSCC